MPRFLIRQPVLDGRYQVVGYELQVRDRVPVPVVPGAETLQQMRDEMLLVSVIDMDYQRALGGKLTFLDVSPFTLANPLVEQLPMDRVVLSTYPVTLDADLEARWQALADKGAVLAVDDIDPSMAQPGLLSHCSYIRLDVSRQDALTLSERVDQFGSLKRPQLVAKNVETEEVYEACRRLGFSLFQGHYFMQPQPVAPKRLNSSRVRVMELLNLVMSQAEIPELEARFKLDAALSYKLLRFINAPINGLRHPIQSIAHALVMLGANQLYRWLTLLLFTEGATDPRDQALLKNALVRARFTESLGEKRLKGDQRGGLFITGVLSFLDVLLNVPMDEALSALNLPAPIMDALLRGEGVYAPYLKLATACENFDLETIEQLAEEVGLDADAVNLAHVNALIWSESLDF